MRFGLVVTAGPGSQGQGHALAFAQAAQAQGHRIETVFFYHDGVGLAGDEHWSRWLSASGLDGVVCAAALHRRGMDRVLPGFVIGGLGQLVAMPDRCDRVVTFAA